MHEFSTVDGFVEISESLGEMIKYLANEPSVGLFYVQQHTQNAVPNVLKLKNKILDKSRETALHTEDLEDSIAMVRSMKECGSPIVQDMIGDINKTLTIMSVKETRKGGLRSRSSSFSVGKGTSWDPSTWGRSAFSSQLESGRSVNYISTVIKSAKEKASNLKWPPLDLVDPKPSGYEEALDTGTSSSFLAPGLSDLREEMGDEVKKPSQDPLVLAEDYDEFKADREAKLREWLEGKSGGSDEIGESCI